MNRRLGTRTVSPIGFGAAGLSLPDPLAAEDATRVLHAAWDAGVTLVDTAACYVPSSLTPGHNEAIIAKALADRGDTSEVLIATKGGIRRTADGGSLLTDFTTSGLREALARDCEDSLSALGVDRIDLYQLHAPPPDVPFLDAIGTLAELQTQGKVDQIGLCNVSVAQLHAARTVIEVASVQNRFSPAHREALDVIRACQQLDVAFLAYSPLGGLGAAARDLGTRNNAFQVIADARGVSPQQVALAWELAVSPAIIPIPGCRRVETALDSARAADLTFSEAELAFLDTA